jgi:adhesin transport system membrane fusion protein
LKKSNKPIEFTKKDYEYMNSLSAAILESTPSKISKVLRIWLITILLAIIWASLAQIDEITRGNGKVIPYGNNQIIQNLEGGIVKTILVHEGQLVKKGDIILKIDNVLSLSSSQSNDIKVQELQAKKMRLHAEANKLPFKTIETDNKKLQEQITLAKELYDSDKIEFTAKDNSVAEQIEQRKQELREAQAKIKTLKKSIGFINEEVIMTEPMVKEGVKSKVDFLKLKREANDVEQNLEAIELSLPRLLSAISEYNNKRRENTQLFINDAKKELNEVTAELARLKSKQVAFSDQVNRTMVRSPVDGIVQKLFVNTVGGVIKPGDSLVEIVPTSKKLYLEIKIKPSDIAFIHPGAKAKVKVSAYDFGIHGGLAGEVISISPDTTTDKKDNTFYLVNIITQKSYLGTKEHPLNIIPGMTVSVDIVTGKKSIMQYILKPILKSKQYVFTER